MVLDPNIIIPNNDTGIVGDDNTAFQAPFFDGQVSAGSTGLAGLTVVAEFNSLHGGTNTLAPGPTGRGYVGPVDATATTTATGKFIIQAPVLPEGYTDMRLVVIGLPDAPPQAGLSSSFDQTFRIDTTSPSIVGDSLIPGGALIAPLSNSNNLSSLSTLSLLVADPASPASGPLATPAPVLFPALNPVTADNLNNYVLTNTTTGANESSSILSANFVATDGSFVDTPPVRTSPSDPNLGRVDLTFKAGLPMGSYVLSVQGTPSGAVTALQDAAGNTLNETGQQGTKNYNFRFNLQSQPVYITSLQLQNSFGQAGSRPVGGPDSYFVVPAAGVAQPAPAPPGAVVIKFSTPLDPTANYSNAVQLIGSADAPGDLPDGDFGTLGVAGTGSTGTGFTVISGTTVTLVDPTGKLAGQAGFSGTELVLQTSSTLAPDHYRIYIPNTGTNAIHDIYGNLLDGEFLGNLTPNNNTYVANTSFDGYTTNPTPASGLYPAASYEDQLPNGTYRQNDLSGDGVAGGAFMSGFTVVPSGNLIYAQPGYVENPLNPNTLANGTLARPYPVLAPQATSTTANGGNLNDPINFSTFNPPVRPRRARPLRQLGDLCRPGALGQRPGGDRRTAWSTADQSRHRRHHHADLRAPGAVGPTRHQQWQHLGPLRHHARLLAEHGRQALERLDVRAEPGERLEALGDNGRSGHLHLVERQHGRRRRLRAPRPQGGDWGGLVFRNYNDQVDSRDVQFPVDGGLQGPSGQLAVSGADDVLSFLNFANVRYAGGAVPANQGVRYDAVTLYNSRPTLTNDAITIPNGTTSGAQAAISGDFDSFREDDTARGPLIRLTTVANYSLNGIWVRPNLTNGLTGVAEESNADDLRRQPHDPGGQRQLHLRRPPALYPDLAAPHRRGAPGQHRGRDDLRQQPALHPARHDRQVGQRRRDLGGQQQREHQHRQPDVHQSIRRESEF